MNSLIVWLAQEMGVGRVPVAPGTFGSLAAVFWVGLLLLTGGFTGYLIGAGVALGAAVWICDRAERILKLRDPGSIVLDEMTAVPFCFVVWLAAVSQREEWPTPQQFSEHLPSILGIILLFRFFDIVKPWPVRQSQALPGGWGVVVDDFLAAVYVNVSVLGIWATTALTRGL